MRRFIASLCLAAAGVACGDYHDGASSTGPSGILVGSGRLITEERPVNGFTSIADSTLAGASIALVKVVDTLAVRASGASVFEHLGDPVVQADASGASVVRRVGS